MFGTAISCSSGGVFGLVGHGQLVADPVCTSTGFGTLVGSAAIAGEAKAPSVILAFGSAVVVVELASISFSVSAARQLRLTTKAGS